MSNQEDNWVRNSLQLSSTSQDEHVSLAIMYFTLAISLIILLHSAYVNDFNYSRKIRIISDICSVSVTVQIVCYIICAYGCSAKASVYLLNVASVTIAGMAAQLCDNYIVFSRYIYVCDAFSENSGKVSTVHKAITTVYIFVTLYCSWIPFYTIVPLFVSLSDDDTTVIDTYINIQIYVLYLGYILFDVFYTILVLIQVYKVIKNSNETVERIIMLKNLSFKAVLHNISSIFAISLFIFWTDFGLIAYNLVVMITVHVLFNIKIEHYFCTSTSVNDAHQIVDNAGSVSCEKGFVTIGRSSKLSSVKSIGKSTRILSCCSCVDMDVIVVKEYHVHPAPTSSV